MVTMGWVIAGAIYGIILCWVVFEFYRAPHVDEKGNIINKTKKGGSYEDLEKLKRGRSKH
jgi:hypothetical protein